MFRNLCAFNLLTNMTVDDFAALNEVFSNSKFAPCAPSQETSFGWIEPRGKVGEKFVEIIDGQVLLKLCVETKRVPAGVLKDALAIRVAKILEETGREKIGRKEKNELKEEIKLDLIVKAFANKSYASIWLSPATGKLFIDTTSSSGSDRAVSQLLETIFESIRESGHELKVIPVQTRMAPSAAMSAWLVEREAPGEFELGRNCELVQTNGSKSKVRYVDHTLQIDEVVEHIKQGMMPNRLQLTLRGRISFVMGSDLCLRNIDILDTETNVADQKGDESSFDASFCIETREISALYAAIVETLDAAEVDAAAEVGKDTSGGVLNQAPTKSTPPAEGEKQGMTIVLESEAQHKEPALQP